jgi:hypothetical protein
MKNESRTQATSGLCVFFNNVVLASSVSSQANKIRSDEMEKQKKSGITIRE